MSEFTWVADRNFTTNTTPKILEAQLGDGYSHRVATTLNNLKETWNLSFKNRSNTDIDAILAFLKSKFGVVAFTWTPPGETTEVKVICKEWKKIYVTTTVSTVTATFERVYE